MFIATVWDPILFTFAAWNFKLLDNKTTWCFNTLTKVLSEIICEPISVGLSVKIQKSLKKTSTLSKAVIS
jgi:hypothetical protein